MHQVVAVSPVSGEIVARHAKCKSAQVALRLADHYNQNSDSEALYMVVCGV